MVTSGSLRHNLVLAMPHGLEHAERESHLDKP